MVNIYLVLYLSCMLNCFHSLWVPPSFKLLQTKFDVNVGVDNGPGDVSQSMSVI